jgi:hypothetical protein
MKRTRESRQLVQAVDFYVLSGAMKLWQNKKALEDDPDRADALHRYHTMLVHTSALQKDQRDDRDRVKVIWKRRGYAAKPGARANPTNQAFRALEKAFDHLGEISLDRRPASFGELRDFVVRFLQLANMPVVDKAHVQVKERGVDGVRWEKRAVRRDDATPALVLNDSEGFLWEWNQFSTYMDGVLLTEDGVPPLPKLEGSSFNDKVDLEFARIVVGGNILSRGFTLNGLTVSYFAREARMGDALLQMERWFGYPSGYQDLTRLFLDDSVKKRTKAELAASKPKKNSVAGQPGRKARILRKKLREVAIMDRDVREALHRLEDSWFDNPESAIAEVRTIGLSFGLTGNANGYRQIRKPFNLYRPRFSFSTQEQYRKLLESATLRLLEASKNIDLKRAVVKRTAKEDPDGVNSSYWYVADIERGDIEQWLNSLLKDPKAKDEVAVQYLQWLLEIHVQLESSKKFKFKLLVATVEKHKANEAAKPVAVRAVGEQVDIWPSSSHDDSVLSKGRYHIQVTGGGPHVKALNVAFEGSEHLEDIVTPGLTGYQVADSLHNASGFWGSDNPEVFVALCIRYTIIEGHNKGRPLIGMEIAVPKWWPHHGPEAARFGWTKQPTTSRNIG